MSHKVIMRIASHIFHSVGSTLLSIVALMGACLTLSCDDKNTSSVDADYGSLRVRQLALSDARGKTVVLVTAEYTQAGVPIVVLRNASGAAVHTIEIEQKK